MLSKQVVTEAERLLALGRSKCETARKLAISRATVAKIAGGQHPWQLDPDRGKRVEPPRRGPVGRCPICRRRVRLPCLACEVEGLPDLREGKPDPRGDLELELGGDAETQRRYQEARRRAKARFQQGLPFSPDLDAESD